MSVTPLKIGASIAATQGPILVIQPLVGIGDMVWHKPWIDALIAHDEVILATKPAAQPQVLFSDRQDKMTILPIMRNIRGKKGSHDGLLGLLRLVRDFKKTGAKRAILLHHSKTYRLALRLAGIEQIAAFGFGDDKGLACVPLDKADKGIHAVERMAKFWERNGWPAPQNGWQIGVDKARIKAVSQKLKADGIAPAKLMVLGIGAMHEERCWPAKRFALLVHHLRIERPDLCVALMGGPAEAGIAVEIQKHLKALGDEPAYQIFETLEDAVAILSLAEGYVGNDTSLLNIAAVLGTKSLGLFSQSPPLTYVSTLFHLDVINEEEYGTKGIILKIEVDDVLAGISAIWPKN